MFFDNQKLCMMNFLREKSLVCNKQIYYLVDKENVMCTFKQSSN